MTSPLDSHVAKIIKHPYFLKLKTVIENNPWHDHEPTYDHSLKTYNIAKENISGDFITNKEAKKLFQAFIHEAITEFSRKDIMLLTALLHDIGKILSVDEDGKIRPILTKNEDGTTSFPGHEYYGSTIVPSLLEDCNFSKETISSIQPVIRMHDTFSDSYMVTKKDWPTELLINDVKSRAEGLYIEALFNIYCDTYTASISEPARKVIVKIFNGPSLYTRRTYLVA